MVPHDLRTLGKGSSYLSVMQTPDKFHRGKSGSALGQQSPRPPDTVGGNVDVLS